MDRSRSFQNLVRTHFPTSIFCSVIGSFNSTSAWPRFDHRSITAVLFLPDGGHSIPRWAYRGRRAAVLAVSPGAVAPSTPSAGRRHARSTWHAARGGPGRGAPVTSLTRLVRPTSERERSDRRSFRLHSVLNLSGPQLAIRAISYIFRGVQSFCIFKVGPH